MDAQSLPHELLLKVIKIILLIITILTNFFEFATKVYSKLFITLLYYRAYRDSWNPASKTTGVRRNFVKPWKNFLYIPGDSGAKLGDKVC